MALLSNFMMPRGGGLDDLMGGMQRNTRAGGDDDREREGGGGGGGGPTPTTEPTPEPPPEMPPEPTPAPPPPGEMPGGPGPVAPSPIGAPTTTTPLGPGSLSTPGGIETAPGRTGEFFTNRFVGGPMEEMNRRQGPGIPGQPAALAPLEGGPVPLDQGGMPTEDMLRRIVERMRRRPQVPGQAPPPQVS